MLNLIVKKKVREAEDIFRFEMGPQFGESLPTFTPGAHVDVHLPSGVTRQYSLCHPKGGQSGSDGSNVYTIAVLREPQSRGGSSAMHDSIVEGSLVQVGAPRNLFALEPTAEKSLLFAGGIGITPILCMAQHLAQQGQDFEVHYCCRGIERAAFLDVLRSAPLAGKVHLHFDEASQLDAAAVLAGPSPRHHLYVCGPEGFMQHVLDVASEAGWADQQLHREHFAAAPMDTAGDCAFEVELASSGATYLIPADRSVLEVLTDAGIDIPASCEQGICGTCTTRVLHGIPAHRDQFLTVAEHARNDQFTPCCSRARSPRLVLDL
ncbi:PDR/VanB family oxidoreductase [Rhodoferax sp.]|uniref:PDR/VanB family oxidoreductase n=1 Tax=Rhodoferax sp. TaxID=50421 RepID=UPI00374D05AB